MFLVEGDDGGLFGSGFATVCGTLSLPWVWVLGRVGVHEARAIDRGRGGWVARLLPGRGGTGNLWGRDWPPYPGVTGGVGVVVGVCFTGPEFPTQLCLFIVGLIISGVWLWGVLVRRRACTQSGYTLNYRGALARTIVWDWRTDHGRHAQRTTTAIGLARL